MRSLLLVYVTLVVPIFFGPYYSFVRDDVHSFAFALFLVIVVRASCSLPCQACFWVLASLGPCIALALALAASRRVVLH